MKTSNKIIIAFSVFIVGGIVTLFSTAKQHEKELKETFSSKVFQIKPFSVVVAEDSSATKIYTTSIVSITEKDSDGKITSQRTEEMNQIKVYYNNKNKKQPLKPFEQRHDTLFLFAGTKTEIRTSGKISSIIGHQHRLLIIEGYRANLISFDLNGGKTSFSKPSSYKNESDKIFVNAYNKAELELSTCEKTNLSVKSDDSKIEYFNEGKQTNVIANLKNNSVFKSGGNLPSIKIDKDSSSQALSGGGENGGIYILDFEHIEP